MTSATGNTRLFKHAREQFINDCKARYADSKDMSQVHDFLAENGSPEGAQQAARAVKEDAQKKWSGKKVGDVHVPDAWIDGLMANIGSFVAVGNFAMTGAPESVGLAWFAVKLTLSAIQSNYELYGLFGAGLTDISEIMIIIAHYDRLYDERDKAKAKWKSSPVLDKIYADIIATYAAVLDFSFSIRRHLSGGMMAKLRHGFKDFMGVSKVKFQTKLDTVAALKKKILEASQAVFQDKSLQHLDAVQGIVSNIEDTVKDIRSFQSRMQELSEETAANVQLVLKSVEELKATTKPKSPWELAVQTFEKYSEALEPMRNTSEKLGDAIDNRHPGTCQWILKNLAYESWEIWRTNVLCLSGQKGSGKSTVLASVVENLELNDEESTLLYLSCGPTRDSGSTRAVPTAESICRTLLYQLYSYAHKQEEDFRLLEDCNKVFENPKTKTEGKGKETSSVMARTTMVDTMPDFVEAFASLMEELDVDVTIAVDEVHSLSGEDQQHLALKLTNLFGEITKDSSLRIIVGCRSSTPFLNQILSKTSDVVFLDVGDFNDDDIEKVVSDELKDIPGLSEAERTEAIEAIIDKAGPRFAYVKDIGLPFMREPFQRPLSRRLEELPQGMNSVYNEALRKMGSNYIGLLRTALMWTLLAPENRAPKVEEIMDAYHGKYENRGRDAEAAARELDDGSFSGPPELEVEQLRSACGPFLRLDPVANDKFNTYSVGLQDPTSVREFCLQVTDGDSNDTCQDESICARCKSTLSEAKSLAISEKEGHLLLTLACLRHLNHPIFQRRVTPKDDKPLWGPNVEGVVDAEVSVEATEVPGNPPAASTVEDGVTNDGVSIGDGEVKNLQTDVEAISQEGVEGREADSEETVANGNTDEAEGEDDYGSDGSVDDDELDEEANVESNKEPGILVTYERIVMQSRYEMVSWAYHLEAAASLWTPEERAENDMWAAVFSELDYFASNDTEFFRCWQQQTDLIPAADKYMPPLHYAAANGLITWVEHLLKRGEDPNQLSVGIVVTALQAAAALRDNAAILKLLLEHGGDPQLETEDRVPAFYMSLNADPSFDTVKMWLDYGANPTYVDKANGWTALHYSCAGRSDVKVLDLLLNHTVDGSKPNINARGADLATPLHTLLLEREVPKDLLQALLERGADANFDDSDSMRPLQMASKWGDLETLQILLRFSISEIDDEDDGGFTALHTAAINGHADCLDFLAENGAKVDLVNRLGRVALHGASLLGHRECVQSLIAHGAQLNLVDGHNRNPLFFACTWDHPEIAELLLDKLLEKKVPMAEINRVTTKRHRSVLRQAASRGHASIVEKLVKAAQAEDDLASLAIDTKDNPKGMTPLHRAAMGGHVTSVRILLEAKADASIRENEGKTALVLAYETWGLGRYYHDFRVVISLLIDAVPEVATADAELVAVCAANGCVPLLQQLSDLGADLSRQDRYGWTPQQLAHIHKRTLTGEFLKQQAAWARMLPSRWVDTRTSISDDGKTVTHTSRKSMCISANKPVPAALDTFYFEMTCKKPEGEGHELPEKPWVAIGFCKGDARFIRFPGYPPSSNAPNAKSYGYHGDDGCLFYSKKLAPIDYGIPYGYGRTVGCGVDFTQRIIWFTLDGEKLDVQFEMVSGRLFPVIGLKDPIEIETNFNGPFLWKED